MRHFIIILLCLLMYNTDAQEETFSPFSISLGAGFPNKIQATSSGIVKVFKLNRDVGSSTPFYMISGEYRPNRSIGIGPYFGYFKSDSEILGVVDLIGSLLGNEQILGRSEYRVFSLGIRGVAYRDLLGIQRLETYAATFIGYNIVDDDISLDLTGDDTIDGLLSTFASNINYPSISYEVNVGGRYHFSELFAAYVEAGFGNYLVNAGITYKLK